uniref:BEACH-type PH domain-containing protein n=1 Tax=Syphacia muris TaxID=451379 RepID=A0A0N5AD46_9BILA
MGESERSLTMLHLRKTFSEYYGAVINGDDDANRKFERVLPLFLKIMQMYPNPEEIVGQFKELCLFAGHISRQIVLEIRARAANENTESAAESISAFFLSEESDACGWVLLNSARYIALTSSPPVIESMCKASLPSTLVKTLYLFFDLSKPIDDAAASLRQKLHSLLFSLLEHLCGFKCVGEELALRDDLFLLFAGSSCPCSSYNAICRKSAEQLLVTLISKAFSPPLVKYISAKKCIPLFLSNVFKEESLTSEERVEMIICLLCVIKDSANFSDQIICDFTQANGYTLLRNFILSNQSNEDGMRNILVMLMSVITSGSTEIEPKIPPGLIVLPTFVLPAASGSGLSVRNIEAFRVLSEIVVQSSNEKVCETAVDMVHNIYASDPANYFIVEKECSLSQIIEAMAGKTSRVQVKILELVEYVMFHLNYVPCKELIALSVFLKTQTSANELCSCILVLQSLFRILSANSLLKDAFREVGLMETFAWIIERTLNQSEKKLALLGTDLTTLLVSGNNANAKIFRESVRPKLLLDIISCETDDWRMSAFLLVKQLLMQAHSEELLTEILLVLHSSPLKLSLQNFLLKLLLCALREGHKMRVMFRKVGGYLCLMSLLLSLGERLRSSMIICGDENCGETEHSVIYPETIESLNEDKLTLIESFQMIFKVLAISMRYEPSNAKYFAHEINWNSVSMALKVCGAFKEKQHEVDAVNPVWFADPISLKTQFAACYSIFQKEGLTVSEVRSLVSSTMPLSVFYICNFLRMLFNVAVDNYEKADGEIVWCRDDVFFSLDDSNDGCKIGGVVVHPGALIAVLDLLPCIMTSVHEWDAGAQTFCAVLLKNLLRLERNQQVMCQAPMSDSLLEIGKNIYKCEKHLLLSSFNYMFERLSTHSITSKNLRRFLRLGMPLCCRDLEEVEHEEPLCDGEGGSVPITRVKALVSIMTPRDQRATQEPSFVEFDMSMEGFACLLVPSLAPISGEHGGVGHGERLFPPLNGLTLSTWLFVEEFSNKRLDPHPIRLFTVFRVPANAKKSGVTNVGMLACLTIQLSSIDRSLLICTKELPMVGPDLEKEKGIGEDELVRVALADVIVTKQWFHIAIVLTRSVIKHSQVAVYINGSLQCSQKLHYVVQNIGGPTTHIVQTSETHAIIGTPPGIRLLSRLRYKIAMMTLFEEPLSAEAVYRIYQLCPHYIGNFQNIASDGLSLVSEDRICLSLSAASSAELTISQIGSMYSKADSAFIAPYLNVSPRDHSTPLRVLLNIASHALGSSRSFGAVVIGYLGMRIFVPNTVTQILDSVGGTSCLFGLIAMSTNAQELYASLKALIAAVKTNRVIAWQLESTRSYQTLAMLLEEKSDMLNSHILHLVLSLVGTLDTRRDTSVIPNMQVFEDLLCDLDVWKDANYELNRLLYEHFYELITDQGGENLKLIRHSLLPARLIARLFDTPNLIFNVNDVVFNLIAAIIQPPTESNCLLKLGQMLAATLPETDEDHYPVSIRELQDKLFEGGTKEELDKRLYFLYVRNRILNIIMNAIIHSSPANNLQFCKEIVKQLGFDWLLAFFLPGVHCGTVVLALKILLRLLQHESLLAKFREGTTNGGWLTDADSVVRNRSAVVLGFSVATHGGTVGAHIDINPELSEFNGFLALSHLLSSHYEKSECYLAMVAILFGQPITDMVFPDDFSLDMVWTKVFGLSPSSSVSEAISNVQFCLDALIPLLSMVRTSLHLAEKDSSKAVLYAFTVIQMLAFLYQNSKDVFALAHSDEFVTVLFNVLLQPNVALTNDYEKTPSTENLWFRNVLELLKRILCDDISCNHSGKPDVLLDALIEGVPECGIDRRMSSSVLTEVLILCMDHMIATDVFIGIPRSLSSNTSETAQPLSSITANFSYFSSRIVDCLWNGIYVGEPTRVLDFLFRGIALAKRYEVRGSSDTLMVSLDRAILYLLSRPIDSVQVQMSILDTLGEIITNRAIVLSPLHNETIFFGPLTHLLFMLSVTPDILPEHHGLLDHGTAQVAVCAAHVWREVCLTKKPLLESIFKRSFLCELNAARALLSHAASLQWLSFVDSQVNSTSSRNMKHFQHQLQSKITKVATGIQRLTSRKGISQSNVLFSPSLWKKSNITVEVVQMWVRVHISLIRELLNIQCSRYHESHEHTRKWCLQEWYLAELELTRERGLWGPERSSNLDRFALDTTESPCRIRRKLIPNPTFYHHYPYRPYLDLPEAKSLRAKVAISRDSKLYYETLKKRRRTIDSRILDNSMMVNSPSEEQAENFFADMQELNTSIIRRVSIKNEEAKKVDEDVSNDKGEADADEDGYDENAASHDSEKESEFEGKEHDENKSDDLENRRENSVKQQRARGPDNQTLLRLLEQGESLHSMFRCARIQGLDTSEGLLLFGREHYYVVDGFTLLKTREIRDLDFLPQELHDPIVPYMACGNNRPARRTRLCSKFAYDDIREVHKRRYLLQPIAVEVFSADGRNYLLAFPKRMRDRVYQKFISMAKALKDGGSESVSGQRASVPVEQSGRVSLLNSFIGA